jgi:hypothetical protein
MFETLRRATDKTSGYPQSPIHPQMHHRNGFRAEK